MSDLVAATAGPGDSSAADTAAADDASTDPAAAEPSTPASPASPSLVSPPPVIPALSVACDSLQVQFNRERQRCSLLTQEVAKLKAAIGSANTAAEVEEERVVNRMLGRLAELRKEKELLALEVEREEEQLTNSLQRRLFDAGRRLAERDAQKEALEAEVAALRLEVADLRSRLGSTAGPEAAQPTRPGP